MIEVFWDAPYYVHIIIAISTLVIMGIMSVDKKGKFDSGNIAPAIIAFIAITFLWQFVLVIALGIGICYVPYQIGIFIKQGYVSWNTESKASEEAKSLIAKNLNKSNSGKIVEIEESSSKNSKEWGEQYTCWQ